MMDLFEGWIRFLFTKQEIPEGSGTPPIFMIHRFLASNRDFAPYVRWASTHLRDPQICYDWWRSALPRQTQPPRFKYPLSKAPGQAERLVEAVMARYHMRREQAEEAMHIMGLISGGVGQVAKELGVELA